MSDDQMLITANHRLSRSRFGLRQSQIEERSCLALVVAQVREAAEEAKNDAVYRVRLNSAKENRTTGNWVVATYLVRFASRFSEEHDLHS